MYEEFTQNRIAQLRMQKNVSARDMSLTLGQNNSYKMCIRDRSHSVGADQKYKLVHP